MRIECRLPHRHRKIERSKKKGSNCLAWATAWAAWNSQQSPKRSQTCTKTTEYVLGTTCNNYSLKSKFWQEPSGESQISSMIVFDLRWIISLTDLHRLDHATYWKIGQKMNNSYAHFSYCQTYYLNVSYTNGFSVMYLSQNVYFTCPLPLSRSVFFRDHVKSYFMVLCPQLMTVGRKSAI